MILVSRNIRYTRIFAEVLLVGDIKQQWSERCRRRQFSAISVPTSWETLETAIIIIRRLYDDKQSHAGL